MNRKKGVHIAAMDLTTPDKRAEAKRQFQLQMNRDLSTAIHIWESMGNKKRKAFLATVDLFNRARWKLEDMARQHGISNACKSSIPDCRGECCRWHFPRNLTVRDFLIAVCRMSKPEVRRLLRLVNNPASARFQCPLLQSNGCFFSFEQRPFVCTVAYPCHAGESYRRSVIEKRPEIDSILSRLTEIAERI